jgi:hypothetical protein
VVVGSAAGKFTLRAVLSSVGFLFLEQCLGWGQKSLALTSALACPLPFTHSPHPKPGAGHRGQSAGVGGDVTSERNQHRLNGGRELISRVL